MGNDYSTEPNCYIVVGYVFINSKLFKLHGSYGKGLMLVECKLGDLHDPAADVMLEYYSSGTRRFLYNNVWWSQCDVDWRHITDMICQLYLKDQLSSELREKIAEYIEKWRSPWNNRLEPHPLHILGQTEPVFVPQRIYGTVVKAMYRVPE